MQYTKNITKNPLDHTAAWRAMKKQGPFAPATKINMLVNSTRWGAGTRGADFWAKVLGPCTTFGTTPTTVADLLVKAETVGLPEYRVHSMLAWLYTWGGQVEINGQQYKAEVPVATAKQAPITLAKPKTPAKVA